MENAEEARQALFQPFGLEHFLALGEYLFPACHNRAVIRELILRIHTVTLDHLHHRNLHTGVVVLGPRLLGKIVAVPVGAVYEPGTLLFEALALAVEEVGYIVIILG